MEQVWQLLRRYDQSFIPPLSSRENTYQSNLAQLTQQTNEPREYFAALKDQSFLLATVDLTVVGFMSFRPNELCVELDDEERTTYITTIIVDEAQRGRGITSSFYSIVGKYTDDKTITTRTWSTNFSHIRILDKFGFQEVRRIKDARGQGIDTVYYQKVKEEANNS